MYEQKKNPMIPVIAIIIVIGVILLSCKAFFFLVPVTEKLNEINNREHVSDVVSRVYLNTEDFLNHIEEETGYSFSEKCLTNVDSSYKFEFNEHHNTIDYMAILHFDNMSEDELYAFEEEIIRDPYFRTSLGDMKKIIDANGGEVLDEYKLVYVMDLYLFNALPQKEGEYRLITMFYDIDLHTMLLKEYTTYYFNAPY